MSKDKTEAATNLAAEMVGCATGVDMVLVFAFSDGKMKFAQKVNNAYPRDCLNRLELDVHLRAANFFDRVAQDFDVEAEGI